MSSICFASSLIIRAKVSKNDIFVTNSLISVGFLICGVVFILYERQILNNGRGFIWPWFSQEIGKQRVFQKLVLALLLIGGVIEYVGALLLSTSFYFSGKA